jgi:hypothetical protein
VHDPIISDEDSAISSTNDRSDDDARVDSDGFHSETNSSDDDELLSTHEDSEPGTTLHLNEHGEQPKEVPIAPTAVVDSVPVLDTSMDPQDKPLSGPRPSRISSRRRKEKLDDEDMSYPDCGQLIHMAELLSCDAPLCIEKVCFSHNCLYITFLMSH